MTVVPSLEEAFGKTAAESMACGTPVVCFDDTGLVDVVDHEETGYRAIPFDPAEFARGIAWVTEDEPRHAGLRAAARKAAVERFSVEGQVTRYIELYREILKRTEPVPPAPEGLSGLVGRVACPSTNGEGYSAKAAPTTDRGSCRTHLWRASSN